MVVNFIFQHNNIASILLEANFAGGNLNAIENTKSTKNS